MKINKDSIRNKIRLLIDGIIYAESFFHRRKAPEFINGRQKKRILIMRKDGLGDCIVFYPTLKAYRDFYKDDEVTLVFPTYLESLATVFNKDLIDHVIWFNHKLFGSSFFYRRNFMLNLKRAGYDVVIYPVYSREGIGFFMMNMTGAHERIGFDGDISEHGKRSEQRGTLRYTRLIKVPEGMKSELARDTYFAEQVTGKKISFSFPTIDVNTLPSAGADMVIQKYGLAQKKYAVIFPGAGIPYRIWPHDRFAAVIDHIVALGIAVVIAGGPKEKGLAQNIISLTTEKTRISRAIVNLTGETDLPTLSRILARAQFYFGSDTGVLHLAAAVGTPCIGIMGMGGLDRFFPYGDLSKNKVIFDKTKKWITGSWTDGHFMKPGEIHPSIKNITLEDAKKEIDAMIKYKS